MSKPSLLPNPTNRWGCDHSRCGIEHRLICCGRSWHGEHDRTCPNYPWKDTPMRTFDTGATRDTDEGKHDYEGFLSPLVLERFGEYMTKHRKQADGQLRASDNWQKGIPRDAYIKSAWRHFVDWWQKHRGIFNPTTDLEESLCALLFNVQGYLHETIKARMTAGDEGAARTDAAGATRFCQCPGTWKSCLDSLAGPICAECGKLFEPAEGQCRLCRANAGTLHRAWCPTGNLGGVLPSVRTTKGDSRL